MVCGEVWLEVCNVDEMYEVLNSLGFFILGEVEVNLGWGEWFV